MVDNWYTVPYEYSCYCWTRARTIIIITGVFVHIQVLGTSTVGSAYQSDEDEQTIHTLGEH